VCLIDGNLGTARRLEFLLAERGLLREAGDGGVEFITSGDAARVLPLMKMLYGLN